MIKSGLRLRCSDANGALLVGYVGECMRVEPSPIAAANVSTVPQRSPLRYPGGKTWLIPHVRAWLDDATPVPVVIDPFVGGGTISLTAVMEGLADRAHDGRLGP